MRAGHRFYDELAVGWALHALEPEDEAEFAGHLPGCTRCAETVAESTEVMGAMSADLPAAEPSEALRARLRAAVEATGQRQRPDVVEISAPVSPVPQPSLRRLRPRSLTLVAAAVAAVLGLGLWNVGLNSDRRELQATVAAQQDVMAALLDPDGVALTPLGGDGRPVATVVPRGAQIQVLTYGVPVNEAASTTYVLWGVGGAGPQPLGTFDVDRSRIEMTTVGSGSTGLDEFTQYAISLEPGRKAPSQPTEVVATGQVTS